MPRILLNPFNKTQISLSLNSIFRNYFYPWENVVTQFWFLPTLFIIFCLIPLLLRLSKNIFLIVLPMTMLLHYHSNLFPMFLNLKGVAFYLVYFILGIIFARYREDILLVYQEMYGKAIVLFFCISVNIYGFKYHYIFSQCFANIFLAITNFYLVYRLAVYYVEKDYKFLKGIEGNYYNIYLLSWMPLKIIVIVFVKILHVSTQILYIAEFILGVYVPLLLKTPLNNTIKYVEICFSRLVH